MEVAMFMELMAGQVEAGNRFTISNAKYPYLLSMDLPRGRFKPVNRRRHHTPAYVPDLLTMGKTEVKVSTAGRIAMVSPTSCVFVAVLDNSPRCSTLCQVSCSTYLTTLIRADTAQLLQRRKTPNSSRDGRGDTLHGSWWYHRPHHASMYVINVHHRPRKDTATII